MAPRSTTFAPSAIMRARFTGFGFSGRKIVAATFAMRAAYATAAPWLPVLAATTAGTGRCAAVVSKAFNAPRGLNEPVGRSLSTFKWTRAPERWANDSADTRRVGRKYRDNNSRACSTSFALGIVAEDFITHMAL